MKLIAHRGASGTEPENTIRSFKRAEEIGVDMVELDVRESKDGEIVVIHDHSLKRLFGVEKNVADATIAQLKEISGTREIPTLEEVLANINTDLVVEIKVHGIEAKVLEKIKNFPHKVLISSFYPGILKKVRALDRNIPLALIIGIRRFHILGIANYLAKRLNLTAIHPKNALVSAPVIALLRLAKRQINVWTVDNESEYKRMKKLKVDGIFTNYPELMKKYEQGSSI